MSFFLPLFLIQLGCTMPTLDFPTPVIKADHKMFAVAVMGCWKKHMGNRKKGFCLTHLERRIYSRYDGRKLEWPHYEAFCGKPPGPGRVKQRIWPEKKQKRGPKPKDLRKNPSIW